MIENALEIFSEYLFTTLTGKVNNARGLLVKKHSENLQTHGDFSFHNSAMFWRKYLNEKDQSSKENVTLLQCLGKNPSSLVEESISWNLRVKNVKEDAEHVILFLERPLAISVGFPESIRNNVLITQRLGNKNISVRTDTICEQSNCLTILRVKYISKVIGNLCAICGKSPTVLVTSRSSSISSEEIAYKCEPVLNAKSGLKETNITSDEFIRMRQVEMTLIAQHKYGVRVTTDSKWKEFLEHLGESAVAFELLQGRPSSSVKINFNNVGAGASKGASFVLYNCARLETIIRTFHDKVKDGTYPPLPDFEQTDFSLLCLEDEWNLIFNYILGFPSMLAQCVKIDEAHCEFRPHYICNFLSSMVRVFSQYYRRTRILVEPRKHLLPVIYSRIHMLMILNDTLKTCLRILNIKSVSQM